MGSEMCIRDRASTHAKHVHADNQSNTVTDLDNKQQVPSVLAVPRGVGPAVETASRVEKSSQRPSDTLSPSVVPQALYVSAAARKLNEKSQTSSFIIMQR